MEQIQSVALPAEHVVQQTRSHHFQYYGCTLSFKKTFFIRKSRLGGGSWCSLCPCHGQHPWARGTAFCMWLRGNPSVVKDFD